MPQTPKNLIMVIGDGFGVQQLGLFDEYAKRAPSSTFKGRETTLSKLMRTGVLGLSQTATPTTLVVDSAASATQLASGVGGNNGSVGMSSEKKPIENVLDRAKHAGRSTGIVSDARVTHATPASFAAHALSRSEENAIAEQLAVSNVDLILGGGWRHFVPKDVPGSKRRDQRDLLLEAQQSGKWVARTRAELLEAGEGSLLGVFSPTGMMDAMTERATRSDPNRSEPSLPELSEAALARLSKNKKGFVLVVEVAQIDWAGHANDAGWMLNELIKLEETLTVLDAFVESRDDTLLVVTGD
ncbi:MAG: alkaline phosphatase, partial [Myxococcota bacterium]